MWGSCFYLDTSGPSPHMVTPYHLHTHSQTIAVSQVSQSVSHSGSQSVSVSHSLSVSQCQSVSRSQSVSVSQSQSVILVNQSQSVSQSVSQSQSKSLRQSVSASQSQSVSLSQSVPVSQCQSVRLRWEPRSLSIIAPTAATALPEHLCRGGWNRCLQLKLQWERIGASN